MLGTSLRKLIADIRFHDEISVTASFGVAQYQPGEDATALFQRADKALYEAKKGGRNRIIFSDS